MGLIQCAPTRRCGVARHVKLKNWPSKPDFRPNFATPAPPRPARARGTPYLPVARESPDVNAREGRRRRLRGRVEGASGCARARTTAATRIVVRTSGGGVAAARRRRRAGVAGAGRRGRGFTSGPRAGGRGALKLGLGPRVDLHLRRRLPRRGPGVTAGPPPVGLPATAADRLFRQVWIGACTLSVHGGNPWVFGSVQYTRPMGRLRAACVGRLRARTEASVFWARRGLRQPDVSQEGPRVAQPPSTQKTRCPSTRFELHRSSCTTRRGALIAAFQRRNELQ